jgi:DNA-binding NtrC family response regulator
VAGDEAAAVLAQFDPEVVVIDDREADRLGTLLGDGASSSGPVRILLSARAGGIEVPPGVVVLPKPVDPHAARAVCALALRCAAAQQSALESESQAQRLRGGEVEAPAMGLDEIGDVERYEGILTRSPAMKRVLGLLHKVEGSETAVLVRGETGTGKGLMAQAIHARSRRARGRFVTVNLGAIAEHLRESELFGQVRGGLNGAVDGRAGLFAEAHGGCLFIDEIGEAGPALQVALLRALEESIVTPVGSDRPRRVDVRIISGSNRDLEDLVRQGLFRRDLYYRLNVFPIELPALRERPEDIFPLANHFLALASRAMGKQPPGISREARAALEAYRWEGNVRELRNVMERAAILCKGGLVIAADLPVGWEAASGAGASHTAGAQITIPPGGATLQQLEREIFEKTLALMGGNQSRAARALGLCESTFRFRLRKLGIASRRANDAQRVAPSQPLADS